MTLPFMTHFPKAIPGIGGKETHFIEKIWMSTDFNPNADVERSKEIVAIRKALVAKNRTYFNTEELWGNPPKFHTIRHGERFKKGDKLHMVINNRTKNRFQFVPVLEVVSTQEVYMSCFKQELEIDIDDRYRYYPDKEKLAINDGFDSYDDFESYFKYIMKETNTFSGQIIHWTDLRY